MIQRWLETTDPVIIWFQVFLTGETVFLLLAFAAAWIDAK